MTILLHVRRNLKRNRGRTIGVILVIGLTLGMFLVLGQVNASILGYTDQVVGSVPNIVTVQPAGGSIGGGAVVIGGCPISAGSCGPLGVNSSALKTIDSAKDAVAVQRVYFSTPAPGSSSNTASGKSSCQIGNQVIAEDTTSPSKLLVGGVSGATSPTITSGRGLDPSDENTTNAIVGQQYATDNGLSVGDQFSVNGHEFNIVGIFSGSGCEGDIAIVPYPAGTAALAATSPELVYVYADSYQDVNSLVSYLQGQLGSSYSVENLASVDHNALQNDISSILFSSEFGEYTALVTGASVMVVVMILVTSRRTKEIGLLKALGYSGGRILGQILLESLILALVGFPLALVISLLSGPAIANSLLGHIGVGEGGAVLVAGSGGATVAGNPHPTNPFLENISFALTPEILMVAALIAAGFGVLGALYPAIKAMLLRPTEALRRE